MINLHRVKVISTDYGLSDIYIDDTKVKGIQKILVEREAVALPKIDMTIIPSQADVDVLGDMHLKVDVDDLRDAIMCIQLSLKLDDDFRNAIKAGIDSVLREYRNREPDLGDKDLSDSIMDVVFNTDTEML